MTREEQERVESIFEQSALGYEEQQREQYVRSWIAYHDRQLKSHEATFGGLASYHRAERARYQQMLSPTTEGEADG